MKLIFWKGFYQGIPETIGAVAVDFSNSSSADMFSTHYRGIVQARQTELALALELFRVEHGTYPEKLDELQEKFSDEIPSDPFTDGEAFRYSRLEKENKSGYVLYSVGQNGVDDGGLNKSEKCPEFDGDAEVQSGDDIRIFLLR